MEKITLNRHPVLFRFFFFWDGLHHSILSNNGFHIGQWYAAKCRKAWTHHSAPSEDCSCGFYVFTDSEAALRGRGSLNVYSFHSVVLAAVEIDGRVCLHENGLRIERMRILRSWPVNDRRAWAAAEALERVYKRSPLYRQPPQDVPQQWKARAYTASNMRILYGG